MKIFILVLAVFAALSPAFAHATSPVFYAVSPFYFSRGHEKTTPFREIKKRLPEIKSIGATVLWLQPVFPAAEPGQGYDTFDYFNLNPAFGTESDFRALVTSAHALGMKVVLDIALNHTSLQHPLVASRPDFYQHKKSTGIPYAHYMNELNINGQTFIYYFWDKLINLDYENPQVQKYALSVLRYWVEKYDVDGFRFDASWGPSTRWPLFYSSVSSALRKLKPNVLLIAEDKANFPSAYKDSGNPHLKNSGFDFGYDWNSEDPYYVSKWSFQSSTAEEEHETIFNSSDKKAAADDFYHALKTSMKKESVPALRYIQNNDTASFLQHHTRAQTKWAALTMILLPGSPLLFYGQAEGMNYEKWHLPSFDPAVRLRDYDRDLWDFYKRSLQLRKSLGVFTRITSVRKKSETIVQFTVEQKHVINVDFKKESTQLIR